MLCRGTIAWRALYRPRGATTLQVAIEPSLEKAGIVIFLRNLNTRRLHPGTNVFTTEYGENDIEVACMASTRQVIYRHFVTNWHDSIGIAVNCRGRADEFQCTVSSSGRPEQTDRLSCS
jgi:hypothetical protein